MARNVSVTVNNVPIDLDYYVHEHVEHVVVGIVGALRDTGKIESLKLTIDSDGQVKIDLNNTDVPLKEFPMLIIRTTIEGMLKPCKGVEFPITSVEITIDG